MKQLKRLKRIDSMFVFTLVVNFLTFVVILK